MASAAKHDHKVIANSIILIGITTLMAIGFLREQYTSWAFICVLRLIQSWLQRLGNL